jgi:hypothetical protein
MFPLAFLVAVFHHERCRNEDEWHQDGDDRNIKWIHQSLSSGSGRNGSGSVETPWSRGPVVAELIGFAAHDEMMPTSRRSGLAHGNLMAHLEARVICENLGRTDQ